MITFNRLGRNGNLGNSMFQLAMLIGVSEKLNYEVKIPHHATYFDANYNCNNVSVFDGFDIDVPVITNEENYKITRGYNEAHFHFDPKVFEVLDGTDFLGYFQSERYFAHARERVLKTFSFKTKHVVDANAMFSRLGIDPSDTVSIHVRRGDYTVKQDYHPLQDSAYFQSAYEKAKAKNILVFSDDIDWCKKNIAGKNIEYSESGNAFTDMYAMSKCKNNIIVNSTFGWWGAWLNTNPEKLVVAPSKWFGPAYNHVVTKDIIPQTWTII